MRQTSFTSTRGRNWPRRLPLLAAVAAVAVSLFLQHQPAHAAATLTVSPNPVIFAAGQQTGAATVQWNTDLPGGSIVTMVRDDGHTGSFRTLRRRIDVDFMRIHVIDDGEGFGAGNADAQFELRANTEPSVVLDYRGVTVPAVRSGVTISGFSGPLARITIENAPTALRLSVFGVDEDPEGPLAFEPPSATDREGSSSGGGSTIGSDFNDEWGRGTYTTGIWRTGPAEAYDQAFELDAHGGDLRFTVSGEFRVRYVP